jgi:AraC family transcriptional regulator of adaptative response / DNA-3-methyladenine glycosylase II
MFSFVGELTEGIHMIIDDMAYRALAARDPRFDGVFYVGVTSTGIYCRPICTAKTPQQKNCRFFETPEAAEKARFRPCLRCRPELAPGDAPIDDAHRIAHLLGQRIEESLVNGDANLEDIAAGFELSSRQVRRIVQKELGVSPVELLQTRRLLLAKQLLTETRLPMTEIAFASGFSSLRRFNEAFQQNYRMPPTRLRKKAAEHNVSMIDTDTSTLQLAYRPPYDWEGMLEFLKVRMIKDVEHITGEFYARTMRIGKHTGWIKVTHVPEKRSLTVEFTHSLTPVLPVLLGRVRNLFDLSARPDLINAHLAQDKRLKASVARNPGLRVPGVCDGFEIALRAILGQQITVKAATTIACRVADAFGKKIDTPFCELNRLTPSPERLAKASVDDIAKLGIVNARAKSVIALAQAFVSGKLRLESGLNPETTIKQLVELPGVGQWTAHYIAMRGLRWPDAFPKEDIAIRKAMGNVSAKKAEELSQAWRPWRSYAVLHLWKSLQEDLPGSDAAKIRRATAKTIGVNRTQTGPAGTSRKVAQINQNFAESGQSHSALA